MTDSDAGLPSGAGSTEAEPAACSRRSGHVCWVHHDPAAFRQRASAFLAEGLTAGHRLVYTTRRDSAHLRDVDELAAADGRIDRGSVTACSVDDLYTTDEVMDPSAQVAAYAAATREALEMGYTGLRVVVDATDLVATPAQRHAFACYEHLVDRYMVDHPFFAMCAYDIRALGADAAAELACLHPSATSHAAPFQWYAAREVDVELVGEIDVNATELFDTTLERTVPLWERSRSVVDASGLTFIDHRGLLALERHAQRNQMEITLRTEIPVVPRLVDLLGLQAVRLEGPR